MARRRVDALLVERGLAPDLARARALIMGGHVVAGERRVDKAGELVREDLPLRVKGREHAWVSRGGVKLAAALDHFAVDVRGLVALDLGASTGGFTDVLLQRGAARVYAVDVGYGQLAWSLQQDPRVVNLERTRITDLDASRVPEPCDLMVADVSFTSLTHLLPVADGRMRRAARAVLLVKPQFELPPALVGAGGVVTEPAHRAQATARVVEVLLGLGYAVAPPFDCPLPGADGNVEVLLSAVREG